MAENGVRKNTRPAPSYFQSMTICNHRSFGLAKQTLKLSDNSGLPARWTIILGENGTGKTTLLQSLVVFNDFYIRQVQTHNGVINKHPVKDLFGVPSWDYKFQAEKFEIALNSGENSLSQAGSWSTISIDLRCDDGPRPSIKSSNRLDRWIELSVAHLESIPHFPDCYGYGAGRRLGQGTLEDLHETDSTASLFDETVQLRNAEEWLLRLDYSSKSLTGTSRQKQRLEQVKGLLIEILPDVEDIRFIFSGDANPKPRVEFETPYGWVPLRYLGYGYRTLIAWMVDFASRMVELYPDIDDPLAEPAVVLVDEIDLHLHPAWQRKLINYLTERFPKTQFIATAHSPLIVQAASAVNANIVLLRREGDHVVIENDKTIIPGLRIDQILTSDLFGLESARPPDLDEPLKRRKELLTKAKLTKKERDELVRLDAQIGTLPFGEDDEEARKMMSLVEETQRLIREHSGKKP